MGLDEDSAESSCPGGVSAAAAGAAGLRGPGMGSGLLVAVLADVSCCCTDEACCAGMLLAVLPGAEMGGTLSCGKACAAGGRLKASGWSEVCGAQLLLACTASAES